MQQRISLDAFYHCYFEGGMKQYRALLPRNILQVRGKSANSNNSPSFNNNCNDKNCDKEKSRQNQELPFSLESSPSFTLNTTKTRTTATDKMSTNESHSLPSVEVKRTSSAGISSLLNQPLITSPTSSENFQYYEIEDNPKRSKNAEASARFRQRRKVREKKMQEQSKILQQKVYNMQTEAERLSMEVNRMKANFETSKNTTKLLQSTVLFRCFNVKFKDSWIHYIYS